MKHYLLTLVCVLLVGCGVYKPEPKIETVILASTPALKSTLYNDVEDKMMLEFDKYKLNPKLIYKTKYEDILKQIIHYKKKVEDSYWKITSRFKSEKVFQDDLYNFLTEEGRFPDIISKEREIASGKVDLSILDVPIELKLNINGEEIGKIIANHTNQTQQYCSELNSAIGFLIILKTESQDKPDYRKIEDFFIEVVKEGDYPILIFSILIRGGRKIAPSKL